MNFEFKQIYEAPQLEIVDVALESGFAASASTIDTPEEVVEDSDYWA